MLVFQLEHVLDVRDQIGTKGAHVRHKQCSDSSRDVPFEGTSRGTQDVKDMQADCEDLKEPLLDDGHGGLLQKGIEGPPQAVAPPSQQPQPGCSVIQGDATHVAGLSELRPNSEMDEANPTQVEDAKRNVTETVKARPSASVHCSYSQ